MTKVILSIKPKWAHKILRGEKKVELRKSAPSKGLTHITNPSRLDIDAWRANMTVYLYATSPVKMVVGEFYLSLIHKVNNTAFACLPGSDLIDLTRASCVDMDEICEYVGDGDLYMWFVNRATLYVEPRPLSDFGFKYPPQSWRYVNEGLNDSGYKKQVGEKF